MTISAIHYQVLPADPAGHLFQVVLQIQNPNPAGQKFSLPTWIPGSYMIRDFAKNIIDLQAVDSAENSLKITSLDKTSWCIEPCATPVRISYQVYAWDLSVRTAHFDSTHGFFNGTSMFLQVAGQEQNQHSVEILPAPHNQIWLCATTLPKVAVNPQGFGLYRAESYFDLIDFPVEMGTFDQATFIAGGKEHKIIITGKHDCDFERLTKDLAKICQAQIDFFGEAPFEQYLFMVMATGDGYGGLEHKDSTALICRRDDLPFVGMEKPTDDYLQFLELCSHEYFHLWNVKRILPAKYQNPDLAAPVYTDMLWWFEGATSAYDQLFLYRAGIIDTDKYLQLMAKQMTSVYRMPGRLLQSVAESSFHTWTKFYQQAENAPNSIISYYSKGALIVLGLDFEIRKASENKKTIDDLLLKLWTDFGAKNIGLAEGEIEQIASEIAGTDLSWFFDQYLRGTEDLPFADWLAEFGIEFSLRPQANSTDLGGFIPDSSQAISFYNLGANLRATDNQSVLVANVWHESPAYLAGIAAQDEIIAINEIKVKTPAQINGILARTRPGCELTCHFFRRDELMQTKIIVDNPPADRVSLRVIDNKKAERYL